MKKMIPFISLAFLFTACNTGTPKQAEVATVQAPATAVVDTNGLTAFQNWKAQNELTVQEQPAAPVASVAQAKYEAPKRSVSAPKRSVRQTAPKAPAPAAEAPATTDNSTASGGGGSMSNESAEAAKAEKKKGWSKATKGAVIGGAAGAAAGAILVKKNKAAGAVIGGVVGAIGGHVIGGKMDKKDTKTNFVPAEQ